MTTVIGRSRQGLSDELAFEYRSDAVTSDDGEGQVNATTLVSTDQDPCHIRIVALGPVRSGRTGTTNQSQKHPEMRIHDTIAATNDMP
mmetsp:Transcript_43667/g.48931  ORF Transcript_43667/g.48931 Transcript_43667/m.48931 type:complete len:88 (-) Transcript_43667:577-840(-)